MKFITFVRNTDNTYSLKSQEMTQEIYKQLVMGSHGRALMNFDKASKALTRTYTKFPWLNKERFTFTSNEERDLVIDWLSQIPLYKEDSVWNTHCVATKNTPKTRDELIAYYTSKLNDEYNYRFPNFGKIHSRTAVGVECEKHGLIDYYSIGYLITNRYIECPKCETDTHVSMVGAYTATGKLTLKATNLQCRKHYLNSLDDNFTYKFDMSNRIQLSSKVEVRCKKHPKDAPVTRTIRQLQKTGYVCPTCSSFDLAKFLSEAAEAPVIKKTTVEVEQEEFIEDCIGQAMLDIDKPREDIKNEVSHSASETNKKRKALINERKRQIDNGEVTLNWAKLEEDTRIRQAIIDKAKDSQNEVAYIVLQPSGEITLEWEPTSLIQSQPLKLPEGSLKTLEKLESVIYKLNTLPDEHKELAISAFTLAYL